MKLTMLFNGDNHEDRLAFKRALNGTNAYIALFKISNDVFRQILKYNGDKFSEETILAIEGMREKFNNILDDCGIDLNDLD